MGASNNVSVMIKETYFKPLYIGKKYCLIVCRQGGIITKVHMATTCGRRRGGGAVLGNFIKNKLKIIKRAHGRAFLAIAF
jgi:hypothetical protein